MKQKNAANGVMSRLHRTEEEIFIDSVFQNWATESALSKVMKHYAGKMDQKKHQLEAVQTMFKSFANQLEQGIGNTPRSQRKSASRKSAGSDAPSGAPPLPSS